MLDIRDYDWSYGNNKIKALEEKKTAKAIAFVIDEETVETIAVETFLANIIFTSTEFTEAVSTIPEMFAVNMIKDGVLVDTLLCSEKLQAIMLSEPSIHDISNNSVYKYADMVAPGWTYRDGQFIIPGELE